MALTSTAGQILSVSEPGFLGQRFLSGDLGFDFCRESTGAKTQGDFVWAEDWSLFSAPGNQFMGELNRSHDGNPVE